MILFQNKNFNSILFLSLCNFLFFIIFFIYYSNKFYTQIELLEKNLNLIRNEVVLLKAENITLSQELKTLNFTKAELVPIIPEILNDSQFLLIKIIFIVAVILFLTFLIYFFSTSLCSWLYKSVILKLIAITDVFTLKLLTILGCGPVHSSGFTDTAGNMYIVKLDLDDSTVQILIKAVNTYDYISVDHYIQSLNLNITTLIAQVNAILNSAPPNEVISTIGIESTINILTSVPSADVASLIESLF